MPSSLPVAEAEEGEPPLLSQNLRTPISFLLFLHFFALFVAIVSNFLSSPLEAGLRSTPAVVPYLTLLHMDLSYAYHLTYGNLGDSPEPEVDAQYWVETDLKVPDGAQENKRLPESNWQPRIRRQRYENLARQAALNLGNQSEARLLQAIAARLLYETGATGGSIRSMRSELPVQAYDTLPSEGLPRAYSVRVGPPRKLYDARILLVGDRIELLKIESASDSAPVPTGNTPVPPNK